MEELTNHSVSRGILTTELDNFSGEDAVRFVRDIESLGYDSCWIPEVFGREPMAMAGYLLAKTERIHVASGIANIYVRDPQSMLQARHTLAEFSHGRFILGLGVSNAGLIQSRGHTWQPFYKIYPSVPRGQKAFASCFSVASFTITKGRWSALSTPQAVTEELPAKDFKLRAAL
jgi:alkanesulfonate monooxygenase SsuD/methylene tetrahydromethanopterin reductase-like flavin-dependent oxidoreductase (luciferase family)